MNVEEKRQLELTTMRKIIGIYCHHKHKSRLGAMASEVKTCNNGATSVEPFKEKLDSIDRQGRLLCPECQELWNYARGQIMRCPHMKEKTFCSVCRTHCYEKEHRERIRQVMRYGGPRMLLDSPLMVIRHMYTEWKDRKTVK